MSAPALPLGSYLALVGQDVGTSSWIAIDQQRIDAFAACTLDDQFIHTDPERAAETPFGGTIAHGFLTLSLIAPMIFETLPVIQGAKMNVNYGLTNVKFVAPVRSGRSVRGRFQLLDVVERKQEQWQSTVSVVVEIAGEDRPALTAQWIGLTLL